MPLSDLAFGGPYIRVNISHLSTSHLSEGMMLLGNNAIARRFQSSPRFAPRVSLALAGVLWRWKDHNTHNYPIFCKHFNAHAISTNAKDSINTKILLTYTIICIYEPIYVENGKRFPCVSWHTTNVNCYPAVEAGPARRPSLDLLLRDDWSN